MFATSTAEAFHKREPLRTALTKLRQKTWVSNKRQPFEANYFVHNSPHKRAKKQK